MSVFHVSVATGVLSFSVRPALAAFAGGYSIFPWGSDWSWYNEGLTLELAFSLVYSVSYIVMRWSLSRRPRSRAPVETRLSSRSLPITLAVGAGTLALMDRLSDGTWLATSRSVGITLAVPFGKVLFPLAAIALTVVPLLASCDLAGPAAPGSRPLRLVGRRAVAIAGAAVSLVLLTLLYQRGFVIVAALTVLWMLERRGRVGYPSLAVAGILLLGAVGLLRPLANLLATGGGQEIHLHADAWRALNALMLYSTNFSVADVWPTAMAFVQRNGLLWGATLVSAPARVLTTVARRDIGLLTGMDELNAFYFGDLYWRSNFGFNVSLSQDLFINFGSLAMVLAALPAGLTWLVDERLQRLRRLDMRSCFFVSFAFFSGGFIGEPGDVMEWGLAFAGLAWLLAMLERCTIRLGGGDVAREPRGLAGLPSRDETRDTADAGASPASRRGSR